MLASLCAKSEKMGCLFGENRLCTVSIGRVYPVKSGSYLV